MKHTSNLPSSENNVITIPSQHPTVTEEIAVTRWFGKIFGMITCKKVGVAV